MKRFAIRVLLALVLPLAAQAQDVWPSKPVRLICVFPPGGANDIVSRLIAQKLTEQLGRQVFVENRAGANGAIGAEAAAKSAPDGYTLVIGTSGTHGINASLYDKLPYDPVKDFTAVSRVAVVPNFILVNPGLPAKNVRELVALAKSQPGKIAYSSSGSLLYLSGAMFASTAGIELLHIPFKAAGQQIGAVLNNDVQMTVTPLFGAASAISSGKLRALAVTSAARTAVAPDVPTVAESGLPGYEAVSWYGVFVPAATPKEIVNRLSAEIRRATASEDMRKALVNQGAEPAGDTPEEFAAVVRADLAKWAKAVKETGAKPD
jgi:tripartite-type tricarboxylate transporter receptor subunit TctC